jgi:hypothetical protein
MAHVTPDLLYIHPIKTGGTWVESELVKLFPQTTRVLTTGQGSPVYEQHTPLSAALPYVKGRKVVISVRHPLTWYGSLFMHAANSPGGRSHLSVYGAGDPHFKAVLHGMTHPTAQVVSGRPFIITGTGRDQRSDFLRSGGGLYAFHFRFLGCVEGRWAPTVLLRQEFLRRDFDALVGGDSSEAPNLHAGIRPPGVLVPSGPYREWYDDEMLGWVEAADGEMAATLGYDVSAL